MALSNATRLSDFGSGIGTQGAAIKVDNTQNRVGLGTTNPQAMVQVGQNITMDGGASGVITATKFVGDGSSLTGVAATDNINTNNIQVSGMTTFAAGINASGVITATSFKGSGADLTDVISGVELQLSGTTIGTAVTAINFGVGFSSVTPVRAGLSTVETSRILTIGVRTGAAVTFSISGSSFNVSGRGGNVAIDV